MKYNLYWWHHGKDANMWEEVTPEENDLRSARQTFTIAPCYQAKLTISASSRWLTMLCLWTLYLYLCAHQSTSTAGIQTAQALATAPALSPLGRSHTHLSLQIHVFCLFFLSCSCDIQVYFPVLLWFVWKSGLTSMSFPLAPPLASCRTPNLVVNLQRASRRAFLGWFFVF